MAYNPSDGTTLTELIRLVRIRLGDFPAKQRQVETGDGVKAAFRLHETIREETGITITVAGVSATHFTADYDGSWVVFDGGFLPVGEIIFSYSSVVWTDERVTDAVNAAIDQLFGSFYVRGENHDLYTDGQGELLIETAAGDDLSPDDRVTGVEWWNGSRWVRLDSWHIRTTPEAKYVVFENLPAMGTQLRVCYVVRPGILSDGDETIEGTSGLPSRAKEPLVLYATSMLVTDRLHHRIRDDRGHNTQNENGVKSYEIQNDAQYLRAQAQLLISSLRMDSLIPRVRY